MIPGIIAGASQGESAPFTDLPHANTILLIEGLGAPGDTRVLDESAGVHWFGTSNGNVQIVDSSPAPVIGTGSIAFDGTGDWLEWADHADWTLGSNDFTLAMIFSFESASLSLDQTIISHYNATTTNRGWILGYNGTTGNLNFTVSSDGSNTSLFTLTTPFTPVADTPYFLLITRSGNDWRMHLAEADAGSAPLVASDTSSIVVFNANVALMVGRAGNTSPGVPLYFHGTINTLALAVGVAWQASDADAVIPSAPFERDFTDSYWPSVGLLVDATGKADGAAPIDASLFSRVITAVGNAQILTNKIELDGTGDWLTAPDSAQARFALNNTQNFDFTLEAFGVVFDAAGGSTAGTAQPIMSHYDAFTSATNQRSWTFFQLDGSLFFTISSDGSAATHVISFAWVPTIGQAYDLAVVRFGSDFYLYIDGTRVATGSSSANLFNSTSPWVIGGQNTRATSSGNRDDFDGRIGAIRLTFAARYTGASYSVPSLPLPVG